MSELPTSADTGALGSGRSTFRTSVINLDRPGDPSVFDEKTRLDAAELKSRYPAGQERSALLPLLHLVQSVQGHVTPDGIAFCADQLGITKAQVAAVATFYTMYKREPTGDWLVSVCTNTLCGFLGGDEIYNALSEELGVGHNQTTADGTFTFESAECLAACDYAPVVTVNYEFFDNQTVDSALGLVQQLRDGQRPMPTRGAPLCTFKQISRQIAGFYDDESALALDANGTGPQTEAGVRLAVQRGESAPSYALGADGRDGTGDTGDTMPANGVGAGTRSDQPTSQHDAPLTTSGSDPAHPAKPAGEEAK